MRLAPPQYAMTAGEVSPTLHGRPDYQRHQTGLRTCRGFLPLRQGGITRAPGTTHLGTTRNEGRARLLPFEFAENDAVTIELTDMAARFWRYGELVEESGNPGVPYELVTPFAESILDDIQTAQAADRMYLAHQSLPIQALSRFALNNWTVAQAAFDRGPFRAENSDDALTVQASGETGTVTLTASAAIFEAGQVGGLFMLRPVDDDVPGWVGNETLTVGAVRQYDGRYYNLTQGTSSGITPPTHRAGAKETQNGIRWRYRGDGTGIVRITAVGGGGTTATATVLSRIPSGCVAYATPAWAEGAWSDKNGWPRAIAIYDERLWAACTTADPRTLWASARGDFLDMRPGTEADAAFAYTIGGQGGFNRIVWLRPGAQGLWIGSLGEEILARSTDTTEALGLYNISFDPQSEIGVANAEPVAPYGNPIFVSRDRSRLFEMRYSLDDRKNVPVELSLPSDHIAGRGIESIVWQGGPTPYMWCRLSSGDLAAMIYDPREDVIGWATIPIAAETVESLSVTPSATGREAELHLVVKRIVAGQERRFVERQSAFYDVLRGAKPWAEAHHLFAALTFSLAQPQATLSGLDHLEGATVHVWTNQGELGPLTVSDGAVTLPDAVSVAVVGLFDETHLAETLDIAANVDDGAIMGREKRVVAYGARLLMTAGLESQAVTRRFGRPPRASGWRDVAQLEVPTDQTVAHSGVVHVGQPASMGKEAGFAFRPVGGAPATITGLVPVIELGGP